MLATDAKIVLERAGYGVTRKRFYLEVWNVKPTIGVAALDIKGGTVDNQEVEDLLQRRKCHDNR